MGGAILSKSLIQCYVFGWSYVPSLLFDLRPNYGRGPSLVAQRLKPLPGMQETHVRSLGREDPLEKEIATHSSTGEGNGNPLQYSCLENPIEGGA